MIACHLGLMRGVPEGRLGYCRPFLRPFLPRGTVFTVGRDTSALADRRRNGNQPSPAHQIVSRDHQPKEPVHPLQSSQLDLAEGTILLGPPEHPFDQLALLLTDPPSCVAAFRLVQRVLAVIGHTLRILADMRRHPSFS